MFSGWKSQDLVFGFLTHYRGESIEKWLNKEAPKPDERVCPYWSETFGWRWKYLCAWNAARGGGVYAGFVLVLLKILLGFMRPDGDLEDRKVPFLKQLQPFMSCVGTEELLKQKINGRFWWEKSVSPCIPHPVEEGFKHRVVRKVMGLTHFHVSIMPFGEGCPDSLIPF